MLQGEKLRVLQRNLLLLLSKTVEPALLAKPIRVGLPRAGFHRLPSSGPVS